MMLFSLVLLLTMGCRKDFDYGPNTGQLEFSRDTVFLDTIFTNIGSSTYTLKVYNRTNENINVPFIGLENGQDSGYRLNVDGIAGKAFNDIPLLAKDSMFVFIETTFDVKPTGQNEFLYTDAIRFDSSNGPQRVDLVTLVRDAIFLYPQTVDGTTETLTLGIDDEGNEILIEGFFLEDDELNFTNEKPYVIYGYAAVAESNILNIDPGARVHFHKNSGFLVTAGASLKVNGLLSEDQELLENGVVFEGDRLEPDFSDTPGQWGAIWLANGSVENEFNHAYIRNASIGILAEGGATNSIPTLTIRNSSITNSSISNIWGQNTHLLAENVVLGSAGRTALYCNLGGRYNLKHSTIANYWTNGLRNAPSLLIDNFIELPNNQVVTNDLLEANFSNCIIDGNRSIELTLRGDASASLNYNFLNCSIKFNDSNGLFAGNPLYDFEDSTHYQNILQNVDIQFNNPQENDFSLTQNSAIIDQGDLPTGLMVPIDILGNDRTMAPDLGAYEWVPQN
ncbi:MAG: hypothetical protein ED555_10505 [Allomuricauda sp.]|nr:MAG: hypothetical protein ED555_10505 [Allomuricauda sp.]